MRRFEFEAAPRIRAQDLGMGSRTSIHVNVGDGKYRRFIEDPCVIMQ